MISTVVQNGRWLLVSASTSLSRSAMPGASGSKAETIDRYWTGLAWSEREADAKGFATQREALSYRDQYTSQMEAQLE